MVEEMKEYILKHSRDEKPVLKMAEEVIKDYNLSENKQRLIVAILNYCGVNISEEERNKMYKKYMKLRNLYRKCKGVVN